MEFPGTLLDEITYGFPMIESPTRAGKMSQWRIIVRVVKGEDQFQLIKPEYFKTGQLPADLSGWIKVLSRVSEEGKLRDSTPTVVTEGKNVGKANETNVFTQALRDALGLYNKQLTKATGAETGLYPPMLAQGIDVQNNEPFTTPMFIQRKYNGVRVIATIIDDKPIFYSRNRKPYKGFDDIQDEAAIVVKKYATDHPNDRLYLDAELYAHGVSLQQISGAARKEMKKPTIPSLKLYIYDCFVIANDTLLPLPFSARKAILDQYIPAATKHLHNVSTYPVKDMDEARQYYKQFLDGGYEGAILRRGSGQYTFSYKSYRSADLLKMKPVHDEEYKIIGYSLGQKGKAKNAILFRLITDDGKEFLVTPALTLAERK